MTDWQPIETAPKDGTWILIYWPSYAYGAWEEGTPVVNIGWWKENERLRRYETDSECAKQGVKRMAYFSDSDEFDDYGLARDCNQPTHWLPLPNPPSPSAPP